MKPSKLLTFAALAALTCGAAWAQKSSFGGPSILHRPGLATAPDASSVIGFQPYLGVTARFDAQVSKPDQDASASRHTHVGMQGLWGISGGHHTERDTFSLAYRGYYRDSFTSGGGGTNHFLSFIWMRQLSPRTSVMVAPNLASYSYGLMQWRAPLVIESMSLVNDPDAEGVDNRVYLAHLTAGIQHRLSPRWGLHGAGGGYFIQRKDNSLYNSQGTSASVGLSYALNENQRLGITALYNDFFYPNGFGSSRTTSLFLEYGRNFGPWWHMIAGVGGIRNESERLTAIELDPDVAEITGQDEFLEAFHQVRYRPAFQITVGRAFERSSLSFYYMRTVTPGNGFIGTSLRDVGGTNYSYSATSKLNVGFLGRISSHSALAQQVGRYTTWGGGGGITYGIWKSMHLMARLDYRRWRVKTATFDRDQLGASVGFAWSPGEIPLSLF